MKILTAWVVVVLYILIVGFMTGYIEQIGT